MRTWVQVGQDYWAQVQVSLVEEAVLDDGVVNGDRIQGRGWLQHHAQTSQSHLSSMHRASADITCV